MRRRMLGATGLEVSEIGFGAEWMDKKTPEEVRSVVARCEEAGVNLLDCWMPGPEVRSNLGAARSRALASAGSSKGTSAPHGKTASTCARAIWTRHAPPSRTFSPALAPTTWSWA